MDWGGHIIKCGLTPLLIEMIEEGFISAFVCNGAVVIHDYENCLLWQVSSRCVARFIIDGSFGMAEEKAKELTALSIKVLMRVWVWEKQLVKNYVQ